MKAVILHEVGERPKEFDQLSTALLCAEENKTTGYIVVLDPSEVINLKKGKKTTKRGAKSGIR